MTQAASAGAPFSAAQIPGLAQAIAAKVGDPTRASIEHVTGTRAAANRVASGEEVLGDPGSQAS